MFEKKPKYLYAITYDIVYNYYSEKRIKIIPARDEIKAVELFNSLFRKYLRNISVTRIEKFYVEDRGGSI